MIKEIPILFSTPMVQAELEERKTMTRRLKNLEAINESPDSWSFNEKFTHVGKYERDKHVFRFVDGEGSFIDILCPYGRPGDLLWVRENFRVNTWVPDDGGISFRYEADGAVSPLLIVDFEESDCEKFNKYWEQSCDDLLKAGYKPNDEERFENYDYKALRLRPNIFLLKEAARIWLKVESVRVERLQDISPSDAKLEGIQPIEFSGAMLGWRNYLDQKNICKKATDSFKSLWESINGADSWTANPFVWVVKFKILSTTGKPDLNNL